jgi:hypothetical protein
MKKTRAGILRQQQAVTLVPTADRKVVGKNISGETLVFVGKFATGQPAYAVSEAPLPDVIEGGISLNQVLKFSQADDWEFDEELLKEVGESD